MSSTSDPRDPKPTTVTGYPTTTSTNTAYAYPYPAPPPHSAPCNYNPTPNPNNNYYPNPTYPNNNYAPYPSNPNPNPNHRLIRRLFAIVISIFILIAAVTFIVWLVLRPKLPEFSVSNFHVSNFTLNNNSNTLSSRFSLGLNVKNINSKMNVQYDNIRAAVFYRDYSLAETTLPPFGQDTGGFRSFNVSLVAEEEYVEDEVVRGVKGDGGNVGFGVRLVAVVKFRSGAWRTRRHLLRVLCDGVEVGLKGGEGVMIGGEKSCLVGI